jgi:hypothetical protein
MSVVDDLERRSKTEAIQCSGGRLRSLVNQIDMTSSCLCNKNYMPMIGSQRSLLWLVNARPLHFNRNCRLEFQASIHVRMEQFHKIRARIWSSLSVRKGRENRCNPI